MDNELRYRVRGSPKGRALVFVTPKKKRKFALKDTNHPIRDRGNADKVKVDTQLVLQSVCPHTLAARGVEYRVGVETAEVANGREEELGFCNIVYFWCL